METGPSGAGWVSVTSALSGLLLNEFWNAHGNGTFDFLFTIPDTGGNLDTLTVDVAGQKVWNVSAGQLDVTGTVSNV